MTAYPRKNEVHREISPHHLTRSPAGRASTKSGLNRSYASIDSPARRNTSYKETFFRDPPLYRSNSIESTPYVDGRRNQAYVNPTFRTSGDFFFAFQPADIQTRKSIENLNDPQNNSFTTPNRRRSQENFYTEESRGNIPRRKSINGNYIPVNTTPENINCELRGSVGLRPEEIISSQERVSTVKEITPTRRRSCQHVPFLTNQRESYCRPERFIFPENQDFDDFVPPQVVNQSLIEGKNRQKQKEKETNYQYQQLEKTINQKMAALNEQWQQRKTDALREMAYQNVKMINQKENQNRNKLKEDLSSMVAVDENLCLKDYLQKNSSQKNLMDSFNESHHRWNQRFDPIQASASNYNRQKTETDHAARRLERSVDMKQERIEKIGQPNIYKRSQATPNDKYQSAKTPEKSKGPSNPNMESGAKVVDSSGLTFYQKIVSKAYNQFNPEVQKKNEHKLKELQLRDTYKKLSESSKKKRIPYSTVSKYLYDYSKADIKY